MIRKRLEYIYSECLGGKAEHIFENGLPDEFQLNDQDGQQLIRFTNTGTIFHISCDHQVPGSIRFEIINQEQKLLNN